MHTTFLGVYMRLIWLSYFDPRKDSKRVWWGSGDLTDARMTTPCCDERHLNRRRTGIGMTIYFHYACLVNQNPNLHSQ